MRTLLPLLVTTAGLAATSGHAQTVYHYDGDTLPTAGTYAGWFTTVGPGHPQGYYWPTTGWSSDGDVLAMTTYHGAGIWLGRTDGYSDPSNFSLASNAQGNAVTLRAALAAGATEWSLYWYDLNGYGASLYLKSDGFEYWTAAGSVFVPVADMTAFHTFGTHLADGEVAYTFDGALIARAAAGSGGLSNFLLLGDGSGSTITGTGTFYVDSLTITTAAGAVVPEPATWAACTGALALAVALGRRRREHRSTGCGRRDSR